MFFDDRLATVLRQRADSEAGARTQFRQLLDILGNGKLARGDERSESLIAAAWLRMEALSERIEVSQRAAMVCEGGWRFRNPALAAHLAEYEPDVASAALSRVQLSAEEWEALIPRLPVRARGFLRLRRDLPIDVVALLERLGVHDRGLPRPDRGDASDMDYGKGQIDLPDPPETSIEQLRDRPKPIGGTQPVSDDTGRSEISALVERIARFRRNRDLTAAEAERMPKLPLGLDGEDAKANHSRTIAAFGFFSDTTGRIDWATAEVDSMVVGTSLLKPRIVGNGTDEAPIERAFLRRQPIVAACFRLEGAPSVSGDWVVDAQPAFTDEGSFSGYVGRFRRPAGLQPGTRSADEREADRIRQLLHELRTPITAVQGYAEVIQQQLFGPAPHEYRALSAAIAADAARILAGFEELDRLARLETGAIAMQDGESDLSALVLQINESLNQVLRTKMAGIDFEKPPERPISIALGEADAEALVWRLLATIGGNCAAEEMLVAKLHARHDEAVLTCGLPASLMAEEDIFASEAKPAGKEINPGLFGAGFSLRLARAEARAAGGDLAIGEDQVALTLPLLTDADTLPSPQESGGTAKAA